MFRRTFLLSLLATPALAQTALSAQDRADLARVQAYLDGLKTLKARFLQVGPQGDVSEGTAWIERPGRLRFEYDPPSPFLLVAGYGVGYFHDRKLGQTSNFPLSATPLGILLADHVTLAGQVTATEVIRDPGQLQIALIRTGKAADGSLTLVFADNPLQLRQWTLEDAQHQRTSVSLTDVTLGGKFDPALFEFDQRTGVQQPAPAK